MSQFQVSLLRACAARTRTSLHILSYVRTAYPLARAPYVVLFDLKPLNEDGNLQPAGICMYCMHAQKGASEAPRTHFRACKSSKFSGGVPPDCPQTHLAQSILWAPLFHLPWTSPILSGALTVHSMYDTIEDLQLLDAPLALPALSEIRV